MALTIVTPAAGYPVSTAEARQWCGILESDFDDLLDELIAAASATVSDLTGSALVEADYRLLMDAFSSAIDLPGGQVAAVDSVKYYDADGVLQTVSASVYALDLVSIPARLVLAEGQNWPASKIMPNAVQVNFTAGYATAADVPAPLRTAIRMLVTQWFETRNPGDIPDGVLRQIEPYRTAWFAA